MQNSNSHITSLINPKIKHLVHLQRKSYRDEHQQFIAQGITTITTLLQTNYKLIAIFTTLDAFESHEQQIPHDAQLFLVTDSIMKKISTTSTPSGMVAIFQIPAQPTTIDAQTVVLHNIQDPGNLGTLIRTAAAMAIKTVVLLGGVDPYHPKVIQATAGTIGYVNIIQTTWESFYQHHHDQTLCALVVKDGSTPQQISLQHQILIIGNEGQGLPDEIIAQCQHKMTIPMPGKTESLNAAVAGAIAMYLKTQN